MTHVPGEIIDITIKGARVVEVCRHGDGNGDDLRFTYEAKDGHASHSAVWVDAPRVTVERVAPAPPAGWPPRQKDLWRDRSGDLWFGVDMSNPDETDVPEIKLVPSYDADAYDPAKVLNDWSPLTLVHREDGAA